MWALILLVVGAAVAGPSGNYATGPKVAAGNIASHTFMQKLDHFNTAESRVWAQDYYETADYFKAGGPALIYVGGAEFISRRVFLDTFIGQLAEALEAKAFALQHRYFGQHHLTEDLTVDNLQFMRQDQAVEDLASFIQHLHKTNKIAADTKVAVYGGGYGGNVATWARIKHPDLVHLAVASGAPLLPKMEFTEFLLESLEFIGKQEGGKECRAGIDTAIKYLADQTQTGADFQQFLQVVNLCRPFENTKENVATVFGDLAELVWDFARTSTPDLPIVAEMCGMINMAATPQQKALYLTAGWHQADCMPISYERSIATATNKVWGEANQVHDRLSLYQSCFEQGQFKTQTEEWNNLYPLEISLKKCKDVFGDAFQPTALEATVGAARRAFESQMRTLSGVIFVQSSQDPYAHLGVRTNISHAAPVVTIQGTQQCADLDTNPDLSTDEKLAGRQKIIELVKVFLDKPTPAPTAVPAGTTKVPSSPSVPPTSQTSHQPAEPTRTTTPAQQGPTKKPNAGVSLSHSLTVLGVCMLVALLVSSPS